jgi:hypothetical protein
MDLHLIRIAIFVLGALGTHGLVLMSRTAGGENLNPPQSDYIGRAA